jgi:hypothetical protein
MGKGMNWRRHRIKERMRDRGFEDVNGGARSFRMPTLGRIQQPTPSQPPQIKAEPRREAAKAFVAWRAKREQP